ncbi:MAG: HAMP domain-containing sensor histidine kinase [Balneolaceae bacterium]
MSLFKNIKQSNPVRWFFFGVAFIAVVALTGLNIYSLYALRETTIESAKENKKSQLEEFSHQVRQRFYRPFWDIAKLDMELVENTWQSSGNFPNSFKKVLTDALDDSLFSEIYFIPQEMDGCQNPDKPIYKYDKPVEFFTISQETPDIVCDGFGISKSTIKVILNDIRWNNGVSFDAHRSMTLSLVNLNDRSVVGYLNFTINRDYLVNGFLKPEIEAQFGPTSESGLVVWVRDWMQNSVIVSNDDSFPFSRDAVDIRQRFTDLLDNWVLQAAFIESPTVAATNASFTRNLVILIIAVIVLSGALLFIIINAQRERELAQRQAGFLANITHELKTPLAVMQAAGENIADGRVTDGNRLKNYGDHIYNEAVRLKKMIEKLLDVAKIDSESTLVKAAPHQVEHLVEEFYNTNRDFIESKGFEFTFSAEKALPVVMIDRDHMDTILNNLVENAVKYSSETKKIDLRVEQQGQSVAVSVIDQGDGINKKSQKHIFDKFYRVENALTAKTKGHGLGLSIVKTMVEINGGKVYVQSQPGKGSVFTVVLPAFITDPVKEDDHYAEMPKTKQTPVHIE